jgi:pimeloyl-ACP methyl ester carboxylesterase
VRISKLPQLSRKRLTVAGASLAIAGTLLGAGLTGTAHAAAGARAQAASTGVKPTIVLVHGAFAGNSSWDAVVQQLQALGYPVVAESNPLRGVAYDSAYLSDLLSTISGPVVLVAHSYGGFAITNVGATDPEVKALVYVDSYLPVQGDTLNGLNGIAKAPDGVTPTSCIVQSGAVTTAPFPGAAPNVSDAYVTPSTFPNCFANGLPANVAAAEQAEQQPLSTAAAGTKATPDTTITNTPAWETIPTWSVIGLQDNLLAPSTQEWMAKRAKLNPTHITEINAPHLAMVADPTAVTQVINEAAQATAG